jgi:CBS-domain-containing membrane protein
VPAILTVADIMDRDVPTVRPDDTVEALIRVLQEHELPGVPVVNEGGRCVGIVTEADLVLSDEESELRLPPYLNLLGGVVFLEPLKHFEERLRKAVASTVEGVMTEDPDTIGPEASVRDAAHVIAERRHNRLPVVEHGRLVGVVTRIDVLEALTREG